MIFFLLFILLGLWPAALQAEFLLGLSWSSYQQLEQVENAALRVRYITPQSIIFSAENNALDQFEVLGLEPIFSDEAGPREGYFLAEHVHPPLSSAAELIYRDAAGWVLLRLPLSHAAALQERQHFLWPLPKTYALEPWLRPARAAKPLVPLGTASMAEILSRVDPVRLRGHVEVLALIDPAKGSTPDNLRSRYARRAETFESTTYIRDQLAAFLGPEAVEIQEFRHSPGDSLMYNVVGTLTGSDAEAGYYVVCAHYDAIAVRTIPWSWQQDPAPGADDNATGTALVLESARILAGVELPWSIRFIAFSGEELGLWGSQAYASNALEQDDRILGVLNFDMIGFNDSKQRLELVTNPPSRWLVDLMSASNERYDIGLKLDILDDQSARLSDHAPFWARGYDAMLGIENYLPTDSTTYAVRQGDYRINTQYHSVYDVPDSINWELVKRTTQLAVATLAQYGLEEGLPNLVVFSGDTSGDPQDNLRVRVSNIGLGRLDVPYQVRVSRCEADSTRCEVIYDREHSMPLEPGGVEDIAIDWQRFGEMIFLLEVDPQDRIAEVSEGDNRAFQNVRLVPQTGVRVFPNPYRPERDGFLRFSGVPLNATVKIFTLHGDLVWAAREDDSDQRKLKAKPEDILWKGVNQTQNIWVGSGVYVYEIATQAGELVERGKIALVR